MSNFEYLFLASDLPRDQLAVELAAALGLQQTTTDAGNVFLERPAADVEDGQAGGELYANNLILATGDPDDESLIDGYPHVWDIGVTGAGRGGDGQLAEATRYFRDLAELGRWPVVLLHGLGNLVAAWNPTHGTTWFPPATSPDLASRALWQPYAIQSTRDT
jgi:hypothetical protein